MSEVRVNFPAMNLIEMSQLREERFGRHDWVWCWCQSRGHSHALWNGRSFRGMGLGPEAENYVLILGEI